MNIKYEIERENNITTYFLDLLNNRGKDNLTIGIYQQPNEVDIIIHSIPVIERNTHKKQHDNWHPASTNISRKKQKTTAVLGISHVK
jgi:hypothetical protein